MPTLNPRIHTVLEPSLHKVVAFLAKKEGLSLSQKVRDLVKESVELWEDKGLEMIIEERRKSSNKKSFFSLAQAKKQLSLR